MSNFQTLREQVNDFLWSMWHSGEIRPKDTLQDVAIELQIRLAYYDDWAPPAVEDLEDMAEEWLERRRRPC
jgi:hypothetical protein